MNNISWRGIRAFILVAEHGSFTAAAGVSRYSKANLSQLVSDLELSLGVQLLVRTTRRLRLTEVGEGYFRQCKQAMLQLDAASDWARQSTRTLKGDIRMNSVGGLIGEDLVAPLIMEFQEEHPEVSVRLDFSSPRVDLIEQHYDLVVRMGDLPDSSLMVRGLHRIRTRYVASPAFLATHGPIVRPADLEAVPLIYGSVEQWAAEARPPAPRGAGQQGLNIASGRVMLRAARSGLGVARLADIYCQADLATGALVEVLPDWSEETQLSLVCPPLRHQLARVRALMSMISDNFGSRYLSALRGY